MNKIKINRLWRLLILVAIWIAMATSFPHQTFAQTGEIDWTEPVNLSNTPDLTSIDPFLLSDPAGGVHLFWAEKVILGGAQNPDTIMYTYWDGENWSKPMDIFFSPISDGNQVVAFPQAVIDDNGRIHLFWLSEPNAPYFSLNYSWVEASQARFTSAWQPKIIIADDLTGTKYSFHIAYSPPNTLHLIYAGGMAVGDRPLEDFTVRYFRSDDLGETWSKPVTIFTSPVSLWGASDTRMIFVPPSNLYASWTLWDDDGNGFRIYFSDSQDNGFTWAEPVILTENREDEYERDWNNLVYLEDNHIMAMWEGGWRAYRQAQHSFDGGATWGDPIDTFPNLIGDNGFVEFAQDSNGTWHSFNAQRPREGSDLSFSMEAMNSLWHSVWLGGTVWSDPTPAITAEMTNPKVAIVNGNRIVAVWYGSLIYEIMVTTGVIRDAPVIPSVPWDEPVVSVTNVPAEVIPSPIIVETSQPTPTPVIVKSAGDVQTINTFPLLLGVVSSLVISVIMVTMVVFKRRI